MRAKAGGRGLSLVILASLLSERHRERMAAAAITEILQEIHRASRPVWSEKGRVHGSRGYT